MNKKGLTLVSVAIIVVVLFIIVSMVGVSLTYSIANAKKMAFVKELYNIQSLVTEYIEREETLPPTDEAIQIITDDEQFSGEIPNSENKINLNVLDLQELDIKNTNYGNKEIGDDTVEKAKDIYAVSPSTGKVYYVQGFDIDGIKYYTLTDELLKMIDKKQNFIIAEDTITFTPNEIGWTNDENSRMITVYVPADFTPSSVLSMPTNWTHGDVAQDEETGGEYHYIYMADSGTNTDYTITIQYTKNGETLTTSYNAKVDKVAPTISKDDSIVDTDTHIRGLKAEDSTSGIKHFKYVQGAIKVEDAKDYVSTYGKKVSGGNIKFATKAVYTLYAEDKAGNYSVAYITEDGELKYEFDGMNLISFTVINASTGDQDTLYAEKGWTWEDFCNSEYNIYGFYIDNCYSFYTDNKVWAGSFASKSYAYSIPEGKDEIESKEYIFELQTITFYIKKGQGGEQEELSAEAWMTWTEFCTSEYNKYYFEISGSELLSGTFVDTNDVKWKCYISPEEHIRGNGVYEFNPEQVTFTINLVYNGNNYGTFGTYTVDSGTRWCDLVWVSPSGSYVGIDDGMNFYQVYAGYYDVIYSGTYEATRYIY